MLTLEADEQIKALREQMTEVLTEAPRAAAGESQDPLMRALFSMADVMSSLEGSARSERIVARGLFDVARPLTIGAALRSAWPRPQFILGPLQPGDVGLLSGGDGLGKSWVALGAGLAVACGRSLLGGTFSVPPGSGGKVLYIAAEDREADHGRRLQALARHVQLHDGLRIEEDDDGLTVLPLQGRRIPLVRRNASRDRDAAPYLVTAEGAAWAADIKAYRLVIIDPLRAFHDLDESDGAGMDFLVRWLVSVAMANQQAILLVHHASQGAILERRGDHHAGRGATDLPAGCRAVWTLRAPTDKEIPDEGERGQWRVLANGKASHGPEAGNRFLRRVLDGVLSAAEAPAAPAMRGRDKKRAAAHHAGNDHDWE